MLLTLAATVVAAGPPKLPVGRWSGELTGEPSGTLGEPNAHGPLLGNGYLGATLSTMKAPVRCFFDARTPLPPSATRP